MPRKTSLSAQEKTTSPDYIGLVRFLVEPFLEVPASLSIDCEQVNQSQRIWIRLAFEGTDKGRVFGRGGRNIQAIRMALEAAAALAGQSLYLDIYKSQDGSSSPDNGVGAEARRNRPRRSSRSSARSPA